MHYGSARGAGAAAGRRAAKRAMENWLAPAVGFPGARLPTAARGALPQPPKIDCSAGGGLLVIGKLSTPATPRPLPRAAAALCESRGLAGRAPLPLPPRRALRARRLAALGPQRPLTWTKSVENSGVLGLRVCWGSSPRAPRRLPRPRLLPAGTNEPAVQAPPLSPGAVAASAHRRHPPQVTHQAAARCVQFHWLSCSWWPGSSPLWLVCPGRAGETYGRCACPNLRAYARRCRAYVRARANWTLGGAHRFCHCFWAALARRSGSCH